MSTRDEAIQISVDDQRIAGMLVAPDTLNPGVLFVHGWGGSQENYLARARQIAALGCVCLTFNLRGRGARIRGAGAMTPTPFWAHAMRADSGRPSSSMRFRTWTATSISVARRSSVRERSPSPITRLNRPMVASARARAL